MDIKTGYSYKERIVKSKQPDTYEVLVGTNGLRRLIPGKVEYEEVEKFIPYTNSEIISQYKNKLSETDYIVIKIAEGAATAEEYKDLIAQRQEWRAEINRLEEEVNING